MEHIKDLVKARRSVRTYDGRALTAEDPGLGAGTDMEYIATFVMGH